jgi:hypothetical protein
MLLALLLAQAYVVLFIALHDWFPLGRLNNLGGIRAVDSTRRLALTTVLSVLPFAFGLAASIYYYPNRFPHWLVSYLWITYLLGFYGMLRAWYLPYLVYKDPERAERYRQRFASTHAFLPERNGIRPDTLHVTFHVVLVALVTLLGVLTFSGRLTQS